MIATFWLANFLRLFHGWQGVILFFALLLVVASVIAAGLSWWQFSITKRRRIEVRTHPDILKDSTPVRPFSLPAAKGIERKRLDNLVQLGDSRRAR